MSNRISNLLLVIGILLGVVWLLGLFTSYTVGGAIHILLVIAVIVIIIWVIKRFYKRK
jgi:FtsH-binding integral membrane protein